ncbi:hypothetical protein GCM10012275_14600 [Longimycelium tulufanense]|uniref:Uncharacterized protein n=1 Tax=Longimycelium tulufanense TaxID=907463 RepID=A0A8J3C6W7_9PSEU|nr:hypothetical protein GCM10012275_14600 [Longimycelium tulufanense]
MLGANVVVVEHPGLLLGQDNHPPRAVGEPLEHSHSLTAAPAVLDPPIASEQLSNATGRVSAPYDHCSRRDRRAQFPLAAQSMRFLPDDVPNAATACGIPCRGGCPLSANSPVQAFQVAPAG